MKTISNRAAEYDRTDAGFIADIHTNPERFAEPMVTLYDAGLASYVAVATVSDIASIDTADIQRQPCDAIEYVHWFITANVLN